jgi:RimJ/RimL family protein N-acetyltransferase
VPEEIDTARLAVSLAGPDDLDDVLAIRLSNPDRLLRTDGSAGLAGHYDRGMLERDLALADLDPERRFFIVRERAGAQPVGILDLLITNPNDGYPWIGAVEIAVEHQRQGYGRETVLAAAGYLAGRHADGHPVRAALHADDARSRAFALACGFTERPAPPGLPLPATWVLAELTA